jgi:hypothetical protein
MDGRVRTIVTIASRLYNTRDVDKISISSLIIHGIGDRTLPYGDSTEIAEMVHEPEKLVLFPGADHGISQHRDEMLSLIKGWFPEYLPAP